MLGLVLAVSGGGKTRSLQALRRERGLGAEDELDLSPLAWISACQPNTLSSLRFWTVYTFNRLNANSFSSLLRVHHAWFSDLRPAARFFGVQCLQDSQG